MSFYEVISVCVVDNDEQRFTSRTMSDFVQHRTPLLGERNVFFIIMLL